MFNVLGAVGGGVCCSLTCLNHLSYLHAVIIGAKLLAIHLEIIELQTIHVHFI